jgi:hypothetical protein
MIFLVDPTSSGGTQQRKNIFANLRGADMGGWGRMTGVDGHALKIGDGWCSMMWGGRGKDFCPAASPLGESTGCLSLGRMFEYIARKS